MLNPSILRELKSLFVFEDKPIKPFDFLVHKIALAVGSLALISWDTLAALKVEGFKEAPSNFVVLGILLICLMISLKSNKLSFWQLEILKLVPAMAILTNAFFISFHGPFGVAEIVTNLLVILVPINFLRTLPGITYFSINSAIVISTFIFYQGFQGNSPFAVVAWTAAMFLSFVSNFNHIRKTDEFERNYNFLEKLVLNMTEGLVIHDQSGRIVKINESACQILEISEDQALGKTNYDPIWLTQDSHGKDIPPTDHPSSRTLTDGARVLNFPLEYQNKLNNRTKSLLVSSIPIFETSDKKPNYALVTIVDRSLQKKTDEELKTNQAMLAHASKLTSLGEMAAGIAHEINNPLAVIIARAAILKKKSMGSEPVSAEFIQQNISTIESTCLRISKIITNMRNFSRHDRVVEFQDIKLREVLDDTVMLVKEGLKKAQIDLNLSEFNDFPVYGNSVQLGQVLMNLIQNSRDAVKTQEEKWIKISSQVNDKTVEVRVSDSGPKISDEIADKIMQPFFTTKEVGQGTGLGLSISQSIIKKHKGELVLDRESLHTEFVIRLPLLAESTASDPSGPAAAS